MLEDFRRHAHTYNSAISRAPNAPDTAQITRSTIRPRSTGRQCYHANSIDIGRGRGLRKDQATKAPQAHRSLEYSLLRAAQSWTLSLRRQSVRERARRSMLLCTSMRAGGAHDCGKQRADGLYRGEAMPTMPLKTRQHCVNGNPIVCPRYTVANMALKLPKPQATPVYNPGTATA